MANEVMIPDIGVATADPRVAVTRGDTTTAQAIEAAGNMGGEVISGIQQQRTKRAVRNVGDALNVAHGVSAAGGQFNPDTGEIELPQAATTAEEQRNAELQQQAAQVKQKAGDAFRKINRMIQQRGGSLEAGGAMARTLVEREMRNIIGLTPGFEKEVRQAASDVMGFDPTGGTLQALFTYKDPTVTGDDGMDRWKTDVGKLAANYLVAAQGAGVPISEQAAFRLASEDWSKEVQLSALQQELDFGSANADRIVSTLVGQASGDINEFMKSHQQRVLESGGTLGFDTAALRASKDMWVQQQVQRVVDATLANDQYLSPERLEQVQAQFERIAAPWGQLIDSGTMEKLSTERKAVVENLMWEKGVKLNPRLMTAVTAYGEGVTGTLLEMMNSVTNPGQFSLIQKHFPGVTAFFGEDMSKFNDGVGQAFLQILEGKPVAVTGDPEVDRSLKEIVVDTATETNNPEELNSFMKQLGESSPKASISAVATKPQKFFQLDEGNRKQFRENVVTNMMSLVDNIAASLDETQLGPDSLQVVERTVPASYSNNWQDQRVQFLDIRGAGAGNPRMQNAPVITTSTAIKTLNGIYGQLFANLGREISGGTIQGRGDFLGFVPEIVKERKLQMQRDALMQERSQLAERIGNRIQAGNYSEEEQAAAKKEMDQLKERQDLLETQLDAQRMRTRTFREALGIANER